MTEELPKFLSTGQVMNLTGLSRYDIDCLVKIRATAMHRAGKDEP